MFRRILECLGLREEYVPKVGEAVPFFEGRTRYAHERATGSGYDYYYNGPEDKLGGVGKVPGTFAECIGCTRKDKLPAEWMVGTFSTAGPGPGCMVCPVPNQYMVRPRTFSYLGYDSDNGTFWFQQMRLSNHPYSEDTLRLAFESGELVSLNDAPTDVELLRAIPLSWD